MNDEKKEKVNNWIRRNFNFSTIMALIILVGIIVTFIGNVRSIPILASRVGYNEERISDGYKDVEINGRNIALLQKDIQYIREGISRIEQMMRKNNRRE